MGDCLSCCFDDEEENESFERRRTQQSFSSQSSRTVLVRDNQPRIHRSNNLQFQRNYPMSSRNAQNNCNSRARTTTRNETRARSRSTGSSPNRRNRSSSVHRISCNPENTKGVSRSDIPCYFDLEPTKVIPKEELKTHVPKYWTQDYNEYGFILKDIDETHACYYENIKLFKRSTQDNLTIENIQLVQNLYLWLMYSLKLEEILKNNNVTTDVNDRNEFKCFHGTKSTNVDSICVNNLNWRRFGQNKGYKFGQGVFFSKNASYASFYTDENVSGNQMFLVQVINTMQCEGNEDDILPPDGFDTTCNKDGKVYVKYDDHTFYPLSIITYGGKLEHKQNRENVLRSVENAHTTTRSNFQPSMQRYQANQINFNNRIRV